MSSLLFFLVTFFLSTSFNQTCVELLMVANDTIPFSEQVKFINSDEMPLMRDFSIVGPERSIRNYGITPLENGHVTINDYKKGKVYKTVYFKFKDSNLIEYGKNDVIETYELNEFGRIVKEGVNVHQYDDMGQLKSSDTGSNLSEFKFEKGLSTMKSAMREKENYSSISRLHYDKNGDLIKDYSEMSSDGNFGKGLLDYQYENGTLIGFSDIKIWKQDTSNYIIHEYSYDDEGLMLEKKFEKRIKPYKTTFTYKYDKLSLDPLVIKKDRFEKGNNGLSMIYKFDELGRFVGSEDQLRDWKREVVYQ